MKNLMKRMVLVTTMLILTTSISYAQSSSSTSKRYSFENQSGTREIQFEVMSTDEVLNIQIKSYLDAGQITIELFNPNNEKVGSLSLGDEKTKVEDNEKAKGVLNKMIKEPVKGVWKIKVVYKNASGTLYLQTYNQEEN